MTNDIQAPVISRNTATTPAPTTSGLNTTIAVNIIMALIMMYLNEARRSIIHLEGSPVGLSNEAKDCSFSASA